MAWVFDAPTGVYRDHALSANIRREAIAEATTIQFLRAEQGYGKGKGQSVTITRILQLPLAGKVTEQDLLPSGRPAIQTKSVTVSEWGFSIPVTEFEKNLSHFDITNQFQALLRDQMSLTMDKMGADALKSTPVKYVPRVAGPTITTNGTPGALSDKNLDVSDLRTIYDYLRQTTKTPYFKGGKYVGILSTRAARGIKNDPEYKDWLAPTSAEAFISGRIKDVEGFMLIESNHASSFADLVGTSTTTGEAVFFGADAGFLAVVDSPELRAGLAYNLGRFRDVGWVGTIEAGLTWDAAAQARVVHVSST